MSLGSTLILVTLYIYRNKFKLDELMKNEKKGVLSLWIGFPILLFTFVLSKQIRYTLPILPAVSILLAFLLLNIPFGKVDNKLIWKRTQGALIVTLLLISMYNFSTYYNEESDYRNTGIPRGYINFDWEYDQIIDTITEDRNDRDYISNKTLKIGFWAMYQYVSWSSFYDYLYINGHRNIDVVPFLLNQRKNESTYSLLNHCDYIITYTEITEVHEYMEVASYLEVPPDDFNTRYVTIEQIHVDDENFYSVLRRQKNASKDLERDMYFSRDDFSYSCMKFNLEGLSTEKNVSNGFFNFSYYEYYRLPKSAKGELILHYYDEDEEETNQEILDWVHGFSGAWKHRSNLINLSNCSYVEIEYKMYCDHGWDDIMGGGWYIKFPEHYNMSLVENKNWQKGHFDIYAPFIK